MKAITTIVFICFIGFFSACQGQIKKENSEVQKKETTKADSGKQMNLLDEQTKIMNQVFALSGMGDENPFGGATNYLELIEKGDMPEEVKKEIRELYKIYDLSLDPKKKKEFEIRLNKKLEEGLKKAQIQN